MTYADKLWLINGDHIIEGSPEDIIINGDFEKLFNTDIIKFDQHHGDFLPVSNTTRSVHFCSEYQDKDPAVKWTLKALKRKGYNIVKSNVENIPWISLTKENSNNVWKLQFDYENLVFSNIYDLLKKLKSLTK